MGVIHHKGLELDSYSMWMLVGANWGSVSAVGQEPKMGRLDLARARMQQVSYIPDFLVANVVLMP